MSCAPGPWGEGAGNLVGFSRVKHVYACRACTGGHCVCDDKVSFGGDGYPKGL